MSVAKQPDNLAQVFRDLDRRIRALERPVVGVGSVSGVPWVGWGPPAASLGVAGDYYLRRDGGAPDSGTHIYFNYGGGWVALV